MNDSNHGSRTINMIPSIIALINSWIWEDRNIMSDDSNAGSYDPYAKDAKIKEDYKEMNEVRGEFGIGRDMTEAEGARLRMDSVNTIANESYAGNLATESFKPLETIEQEKNRLSRQLQATIFENEHTIRALKQVLNQYEMKQKSLYYLRDSIYQSSQIQMDQVKQLREILK
jgi:hypothetical protein